MAGRLLVRPAVVFPAASGGMFAHAGASLEECVVAGNRALGGRGGGVVADAGVSLEDCRVTGNSASLAGGGVSATGYATFQQCTITNNSAASGGGVSVTLGSEPSVRNCILWNNAAPVGAQVYALTTWRRLDVNRSLVEGGQAGIWTTPGQLVWHSTNIADNPAFADADGPDNLIETWRDNDEHLGFASPCIDLGGVMEQPEYERDLDGDDRVVNARGYCQPRPDLGAYEFQAVVIPSPISRLYVNAAAAPGGNGRSWGTAYRTLQDAIQTPGVREVWVARGTYTPGTATDALLSHEVGCP